MNNKIGLTPYIYKALRALKSLNDVAE